MLLLIGFVEFEQQCKFVPYFTFYNQSIANQILNKGKATLSRVFILPLLQSTQTILPNHNRHYVEHSRAMHSQQ